MIQTASFLRYCLSILLLLLGRYILSNWYSYQQSSYYFAAAGVFVVALIPAVWPLMQPQIKEVKPSRIFMACALILLGLPWGEWFHLNPDSYRDPWTRQVFEQALFVIGCLLLFSILPNLPAAINNGTRRTLQFISSKRYLIRLPAVLFFCLSSAIVIFVYKQTPFVTDSAAHLFQAKIFSRFQFSVPPPPLPDFFTYERDGLVVKDGRWFAMNLPGISGLLAFTIPFHAEWLLCPLLGALSLLIWIAYAYRWHSPQVAFLLGCLGLASPLLLVLSSTIIVHAPELFFCSAMIYLCRAETEDPRLWHSVAMFLLWTCGVLVRGFSLFVFLAPILLYTAWIRLRNRSFLFVAACAAGFAVGFLSLAYYQWKTTGDPFLIGYFLEYPDLKFGFGENIGGQIHTPARGLENTSDNILGLNSWLSGWYSGSLFFVVAFLLFTRAFDKWDRLFFLGSLAILIFYYLYFFQDLLLGPRYYYPLAPVLLLMIARSIADLRCGQTTITALMVISFIVSLPERVPAYVKRCDPTLVQSGYLKEEIKQAGNHKTLVFLDKHVSQEFLAWNDPFWENSVVICRDRQDKNQAAIAAFPDHRVVYFRASSNFSVNKHQDTGGYFFYDEPDRATAYLSLFQLAMTIQSGKDYPDRDSFDLCYADLLNTYDASVQLDYLQKETQKTVRKKDYQENFRLGIIHAGQMLLLPKLALEKKGKNWVIALDTNRFRKEYQSALRCLEASGEVGKPITEELRKVQTRIDRNENGELSDEEIANYLQKKIEILEWG